jgi:hypothetical protein
MANGLGNTVKYVFKISLALTPCIISMYLLYWLGASETWVPETPHRDKITGVILITGLGLSFFIQSYIWKKTSND